MNDTTVVLASTNLGKIQEMSVELEAMGLQVLSQVELQIEEIEETGQTFVENALLKARHAFKYSGWPTLADDSGISVPALKDAPGVYSARYAGPEADAHANIKKLLDDLKDVPEGKRAAQFCCTLVYLRSLDDPCPIICQAIWKGSILFAPQGQEGFGYDSVFYLPSHGCSVAELSRKEKNRLSHRGEALRQLKEALILRGYL